MKCKPHHPNPAVWLLILLVFSGCSTGRSTRRFIHPDTDMSFYQRVGVIPFRNFASDRLAGAKMTETFVTELMIPSKFEAASPGEFEKTVQEVSQATSPISDIDLLPQQLKEIGKKANIQGIFMASIHEYQMTRIGQAEYPVISMNVRFVDAQTGTVVWQESYFERGGPKMPILAVGEIFTLGELSQRTCKKIIRDFYHSKLF